jgi:hypothetical protein
MIPVSEYVPANAERLAWLTGFTGSAGLAVILADEAALFVAKPPASSRQGARR